MNAKLHAKLNGEEGIMGDYIHGRGANYIDNHMTNETWENRELFTNHFIRRGRSRRVDASSVGPGQRSTHGGLNALLVGTSRRIFLADRLIQFKSWTYRAHTRINITDVESAK